MQWSASQILLAGPRSQLTWWEVVKLLGEHKLRTVRGELVALGNVRCETKWKVKTVKTSGRGSTDQSSKVS